MLNEFKQYLLGIGKSENTALNYCDKVKLYLKWCLDSFGSEPQQLYRANVLDYISYMKTLKRYNPKSVNNHLSSLRSFNEFLIASGRQSELAILKNDFMKVQVQYANPCTVEQKDVEAFRQRLLEGGSKRDFAIVTLYTYTGIRRSECVNLRVDQVEKGVCMKRKILITVIAVIVVLSAVIGYLHINKLNTANADSPSEMMERVEQALGDEYKKQTETVVAGTIKYADKEGNAINYHILKTTYYEADPSQVKGLNVDALGVLFDPNSARACEEMMIKEWHAARYEFDGVSYLCWTDTPEASYVLEYNPDTIADSEILKMAESAEKIK